MLRKSKIEYIFSVDLSENSVILCETNSYTEFHGGVMEVHGGEKALSYVIDTSNTTA